MRNILVVVDMQKDFIDGSLGTSEAQKIIDDSIEVIRKYRPEDIFVTRDTHEEDYLETPEGKKLPVEHCIRGTEGWNVDSRLMPYLKGASFINKPTFGSKELAEKLSEIYKKEGAEITIIGICTDICVISNALLIKAFIPEAKISVIEKCCAGVTPKSHKEALNTMAMCQIDII